MNIKFTSEINKDYDLTIIGVYKKNKFSNIIQRCNYRFTVTIETS